MNNKKCLIYTTILILFGLIITPTINSSIVQKNVSIQSWPPDFQIHGHVYLDLSGNVPANDTKVIYVDLSDGYEKYTITNSNGYYTFGIYFGNLGKSYQLIVEKEGYRKVMPPYNPIILTYPIKWHYEVDFYLLKSKDKINLPLFNFIEKNFLLTNLFFNLI